MESYPDYVPKVILFTGGAGFIGSNVMVYIVRRYPDAQVICLDKLGYCANVKNFEEVSELPNFVFVKGDITSADLVNHLLMQYKVDTIMHFAAETHVDNSFGNSLCFTHSNILGTHTLLEAARAHQPQIRRFIHVSTDEVYGESTADDQRKMEQSVLSPTNPYAASKAAAEFLVKSYRKSFGLDTIITRGNNVYGPKQYPEKLIPKFIQLIKRGAPCPLHGDGTNRRSFLYVSDVAEAFSVILCRGQPGTIYNIGSDYEISNKNVLLKLLASFGLEREKDKYIVYARDRAFNDFRYHINTESLKKLGWRQTINFEEGLRMTKDWYFARPDYWGDITFALEAHPTLDFAKATSTSRTGVVEDDELKTSPMRP